MNRLYHFSEDSSILMFEPRPHPSHPTLPPTIWAIDEQRSPLYFFPRDCPRIAYYASGTTTKEDKERYFGHTTASMIIAVESRWYHRIRDAQLYRYSFPADPFTCWDEGAGYYLCHEAIEPLAIEPMCDLISHLMSANVELRLTPSLIAMQDDLLSTTLHVSMIRMRNAAPL